MFSVLSIYSSSCSVNFSLFFHFLILSPYSRSYSVHFLFSTLFSFSRHIPGLTVCISFYTLYSFFGIFQVLRSEEHTSYFRSYSVCVPFYTFFSFFAIFHVLQCAFLIFQVFQCFSPYFTSCSLCFSFSMIFSVLLVFRVLQCAFPILHIFECISP